MTERSVLHLAAPERSQIPFEAIHFPDGQQDVRVHAKKLEAPVTIASRMNSFRDLELILCAVAAVRNLADVPVSLYSPYLLGARSDRQFVRGGTHYLRDVLCPIINSAGFRHVDLLDAHSDVSPALIRGCRVNPPAFLAAWAERRLGLRDYRVICPDAGAEKRAAGCAAGLSCTEIVCCSKKRELATGKITSTVVPLDDFGGRDAMIIDDICDGGRTFIELAKVIRQRNCGKLYLTVTHGIFTAGLERLRGHFDAVFCTNSVKDIADPLVHQFDVFEEIP